MSANPYELCQNIDGNEPLFFEIYKVYDLDGVLLKTLVPDYEETMTLNKIRDIMLKKYKSKLTSMPFLSVHCDSGLWGVIFNTENYYTGKWYVYGVTKGYA